MPEPETAFRLVRHFRDERIGLVGANILNVGMRRDGISFQEKAYIERENLIKYHEGLVWGTMMGPFGAATRYDDPCTRMFRPPTWSTISTSPCE